MDAVRPEVIRATISGVAWGTGNTCLALTTAHSAQGWQHQGGGSTNALIRRVSSRSTRWQLGLRAADLGRPGRQAGRAVASKSLPHLQTRHTSLWPPAGRAQCPARQGRPPPPRPPPQSPPRTEAWLAQSWYCQSTCTRRRQGRARQQQWAESSVTSWRSQPAEACWATWATQQMCHQVCMHACC